MTKVLVIGCQVGGLAVIRALGRHNLHILALTYDDDDFADASKYVTEVVRVPHPGTHEQQFIAFLLQNGPQWDNALILETGDYPAVTIAKHKEELSQYYRILTADWGMLRQFIEKQETYRLAAECGVPCPKTFTPHTLAELNAITDRLSYPCLIKPVYSHEFVNRFDTKMFTVHNETQLMDKFRLCVAAQQPVMVQEIVRGPDSDIYQLHAYINSAGEMSAQFFHRKVRENPPRFGVMRVGVSTEPDKEVDALSRRLLQHVNYTGFCDIEFRKDARDGQLKLIEVNARMPRSGWFPLAGGINFPWIIYQDLVENRQIHMAEQRVGLYGIELCADLYHLIGALFRHRGEQLGWRAALRPYLARHKTFAVFDIRDLQPFLKQVGRQLQKRLRWTPATRPRQPAALESNPHHEYYKL